MLVVSTFFVCSKCIKMAHSNKAVPMTRDETMLLVQLVAANKIINNKATNATNNKLKEEAWQSLTNEFNSSVSSFHRTSSQLRLKWENLKKTARKRCANLRHSLSKTGGGKDYLPKDEVLDKVASLLGSTCQGFPVIFGGDAILPSTPEVSAEVDINVLPLSADGDAQDIGVGGFGGEVIETPPPVQNNWFFKRPSGSGNLAKRKFKLEEEKYKARNNREIALTEFLLAKKKKIDLENEDKLILIEKHKLELENIRLQNIKLKADLNLLE